MSGTYRRSLVNDNLNELHVDSRDRQRMSTQLALLLSIVANVFVSYYLFISAEMLFSSPPVQMTLLDKLFNEA